MSVKNFVRTLIWLAHAMVALTSTPARAESTKMQCIQANTNAQSLRREGKLAAARAELRACSDAKCPTLVSSDCAKRLDELENAQPTIVFDVFDASGHEVNDVSVTIDGLRLVDKLDGTSLPVDLGEHTVTFSAGGRPAVTQKLTFREGEKARHVRVTLDSAPGAAAAAPPPATTPDQAETPADAPSSEPAAGGSTSGSSQRTVGYIVGGIGLAGLAVGGVFGYLTIAAKDRQVDNCSSPVDCPDYPTASDAHRAGNTYGTISTVAFIAGGAATATGIVLLLTAKSGNRGVAAASLTLSPALGPSTAFARLSGTW
jgi:hypothetical protein